MPSKEQLSCSELTGLRVRSERCYGDLKWHMPASGSCPARFCPGGAAVVRRRRRITFRGPHDQIKIQGPHSLGGANDQQV